MIMIPIVAHIPVGITITMVIASTSGVTRTRITLGPHRDMTATAIASIPMVITSTAMDITTAAAGIRVTTTTTRTDWLRRHDTLRFVSIRSLRAAFVRCKISNLPK